MRNCEACVAFRVIGTPTVYYPEELNRCASVSPDQCIGDIAERYTDDMLFAENLQPDEVQKILGSITKCKKYPQLGWYEPFPT